MAEFIYESRSFIINADTLHPAVEQLCIQYIPRLKHSTSKFLTYMASCLFIPTSCHPGPQLTLIPRNTPTNYIITD
jgi:hypothetical protein